MEPTTTDGDGRGALRSFEAFAAEYSAGLRGYVDQPDAPGLKVAEELGRLACDVDLSMLQLVGMHLEVRRGVVFERGVEHLANLDEFLSTVLAAFDTDQSRNVDPRRESADRGRLEWLRGLSDAYIAIASGDTIDERLSEVCAQAKRFLAAADTRLVFGRQAEPAEQTGRDEIHAHLLGSAGVLTVIAPPGRRWTEAERTALQKLAALISAPINDARRLESAQRAGELGALLGGVAGPDEVLTRFLTDGVAQVGADRAAVRLFDDNGERAEPASAAVVEAIDDVARSGVAAFLDRPTDSDQEAWAVLPLGVGGNRIGVVAFGFHDSQPFDEVQRSFLADVGRRLTAALDRSRAYASERAARRDAELASARLRGLQGLAVDLARAATRRRVAQVVLRRVVASSNAAGGSVAMFTTQPNVEILAASGSFRSEQWGDVDGLVEALMGAAAPRDRTALLVVSAASLPGPVSATLVAHGVAQLAWQPITSGEREIGVVIVGWKDAVVDRSVDRDLLQAQVAMAGSTLRRAARYDVEHTIADTLQRSLLDLAPIAIEQVRWSVLYRAGSAGLAGGDWYDLIELDPHRLAIVIGDIVGRGVEAAASMGQLRSATRALASRIDEPAEMIGALDQFVSRSGPGRFSSLAYMVLDTRTGLLAHCIAGHPPPILRDRNGQVAVLTSGRGPLLGIPCERRGAIRTVEPGTSVVMYTDGLVERRGESVDIGIERLVSTLQAGAGLAGPDDTCRDLVDQLVDSRAETDGASDDVAIVVVERLAD